MDKRQRENGFSIVEVVLALAIIVTVTITALSLVISFVSATENLIHVTQAQSFADNVWESFKAAENENEFLTLVSFAEGVALTDGATDASGNAVYTHHCVENRFTAKITVSFPEDTQAILTITVTDKNGDNIISFSYRKGDER